MDESLPIPKRQRYLFWLLLAALSTFFAEAVSGSNLFPFLDPLGLLIVVPLYGLHTLVLITYIFRRGRPSLGALFFAGAIFGLYEAYLTKVLWDPPWGALWSVGDVAVVEVGVLALWWHPFMAFIVPLLVGETLFTSSRQLFRGMPRKVQGWLTRRRLLLGTAVLAGAMQSLNNGSPIVALLSALSSFAVLGLLAWGWQRLCRQQTYSLEALLPNRRQFRVLLLLLLGLYLLEGFALRPEALPGLLPQAVIWVLYAFFFYGLRRSLRHSPPTEPSAPINPAPLTIPWRFVVLWALIYTVTAALTAALFLPVSGGLMLLAWAAGIFLGVYTLVYVIRANRTAISHA